MEESKGVVLKLRGLLKRFREADGNLLEVTTCDSLNWCGRGKRCWWDRAVRARARS